MMMTAAVVDDKAAGEKKTQSGDKGGDAVDLKDGGAGQDDSTTTPSSTNESEAAVSISSNEEKGLTGAKETDGSGEDKEERNASTTPLVKVGNGKLDEMDADVKNDTNDKVEHVTVDGEKKKLAAEPTREALVPSGVDKEDAAVGDAALPAPPPVTQVVLDASKLGTSFTKDFKSTTAIASQNYRKHTCPFALRLFVKTGSYHERDDFGMGVCPPEVDQVLVHVWKDTTLRELATLLRESRPEAQDRKARLSFKSINISTRVNYNSNLNNVSVGSSLYRRGDGRRNDASIFSAPGNTPLSSTSVTMTLKDLGIVLNTKPLFDDTKTCGQLHLDRPGVSTAICVSIMVPGLTSSAPGAIDEADRLGEGRGFGDRLERGGRGMAADRLGAPVSTSTRFAPYARPAADRARGGVNDQRWERGVMGRRGTQPASALSRAAPLSTSAFTGGRWGRDGRGAPSRGYNAGRQRENFGSQNGPSYGYQNERSTVDGWGEPVVNSSASNRQGATDGWGDEVNVAKENDGDFGAKNYVKERMDVDNAEWDVRENPARFALRTGASSRQ